MKALGRFDHKMTLAIQSLPDSLQPFMAGLSFLGDPLVVSGIGISGFISAIIRGQHQVQQAFIYAAIAFGLCTLLKLVLRRSRPHNLDIRTLGFRSYSFPSGHAFGTVIFYGLFSYLDFKYLVRPSNILIATVVWASIILVGVSRVYLKLHYPSDVAAGWLVGLISLFIVIQIAF